MTDKELLRLKKKVDNAENEEQQLKGERKAILANLKEDFDCSTVAEAKSARKKLKKKYESLSKKIERKLEEIENKYLTNEESE